MNYQNQASIAMPSANIAVNKSRLKVYKNVGPIPTYYLQKGQEFQIELFNPTQDVILAKISLNSRAISQGGLVLKPGERVFLDRYLDVAKKFMFDTYEVSGNNQEVQKAIEHNGDFTVEFYREYKPITYWTSNPIWVNGSLTLGNYNIGTDPQYLKTRSSGNGLNLSGSISNSNISTTNTYLYDTGSASASSNLVNCSYTSNSTLDFAGLDLDLNQTKEIPVNNQVRSKKSIETGRVEEGSKSNQEFKYVNKTFEAFAFHRVEYKLLPVSQKVNETQDVNVRRYCTNCGKKQGSGDKFCANCGTKQ